jgi:calcineurin-like phosphoesterase family protein
MTNYYTSDQHYCHGNIIKYENRPFKTVEEMDEYIIYKHNQKVSPNDSVYFLGDCIFSNDENKAIKLLSRLNGNKYLLYGNHDKIIRSSRLVQQKFNWCRDYYVNYEIVNGVKTPIVLFHYPIQVWDRKHHGSIHLYGHIHSDKDSHHPMAANLVNAYNVGVDVRNFEPVTLEEILKK